MLQYHRSQSTVLGGKPQELDETLRRDS